MFPMEISHLRAFLAIADLGVMTHAATQLHLTQPALSAQLARLEEELGTSLFDRSPRGMTLTEAGRTLLPYARETLLRLDDARVAVDALRGLDQGSLSIGGGATATTYLLPPVLGRFHELHPGIRFYVREQPSSGIAEAVLAGELDLGVVTLPLAGDAGRLAVERWVDDELRLIVPAGHRLAGRQTFRWSDLADTPLVLFEAGSAVRAHIDASIETAAVTPDIVMELRSIESIKQMVAQGIGAALVSEHALAGTDLGLRCRDRPIRRTLAIIYRADRTQSPAAAAFLELMREHPLRTV